MAAFPAEEGVPVQDRGQQGGPAEEVAEVGAELYRVPPDRFVAARTELVARLRAEGRRPLAAAVGKLRRPSWPAWALDVTAGEEPALVDTLADAAAQLQAAWDAETPPGDLRPLIDAHRAAVGALGAAARRRLDGAGHGGAGQELAALLQAVATSPDLLADLRRGMLGSHPAAEAEADALLPAWSVAPPPRMPAAPPVPAPSDEPAGQPDVEREEAEREERRRAEARRAAEAARDDARAALSAAEAELARALGRREEAEEAERRAASDVEHARSRLEQAEAAVNASE